MTLDEIATPYNEKTFAVIREFLYKQELRHYENRFFTFEDQLFFFKGNMAVVAPASEAKGRTIVPPKTFIKTYYQHIKEETIIYRRYLGLPQLVNPVFPDNTELEKIYAQRGMRKPCLGESTYKPVNPNSYDHTAELLKYYSIDKSSGETDKGDVLVNFTHLTHKRDKLKYKSKLNITKYRRS